MDRKKYQDYIDRQSDAESGVLFYAEARRLLGEFMGLEDTRRSVALGKYRKEIYGALDLAEQSFKRTRNKDYLFLIDHLRQALAEIGVV